MNARLESYSQNCDKILYTLSSLTNNFVSVLTSSTARSFYFVLIWHLALHFICSSLKDLFLFALRNADQFVSLASLPSVRVEEASTPEAACKEFKGASVWGGQDLLLF